MIKGVKKRDNSQIDKAKILNLYIEDQMSINEISKKLKIPFSNIRNWLIKGGIKPRERAYSIRLAVKRIKQMERNNGRSK